MPTNNSSVLVFTFVKTSNHGLHNIGYSIPEATHALQQELKLYRTFAFQVGIAKVRYGSRVIVVVAQLQQAHRPAAAIIFDTEHIFHADIVFQGVAHGREYAPVVIQRQVTGDADLIRQLLVAECGSKAAVRIANIENAAVIRLVATLKES